MRDAAPPRSLWTFSKFVVTSEKKFWIEIISNANYNFLGLCISKHSYVYKIFEMSILIKFFFVLLVSGINVHYFTPVICLLCIFYTTIVSIPEIKLNSKVSSYVIFNMLPFNFRED